MCWSMKSLKTTWLLAFVVLMGASPEAMAQPASESTDQSVLTLFTGLDGSKQPQDYGVNANLGIRGAINYSTPVKGWTGTGVQVGGAITGQGNAVRVYELLGESRERFQVFTTLGVFHRFDEGFADGVAVGAAYDFLYQESIDDFKLSQLRLKVSKRIRPDLELGTIFHQGLTSSDGLFNSTAVRLETIDFFTVFATKSFSTGVTATMAAGVARGHSENNAVTGPSAYKRDQLVLGSDFRAPLNGWSAIYGEANIIFPADTGAVDAFLGIELTPGGIARRLIGNRYAPYFPVASSPSMATDLLLR